MNKLLIETICNIYIYISFNIQIVTFDVIEFEKNKRCSYLQRNSGKRKNIGRNLAMRKIDFIFIEIFI